MRPLLGFSRPPPPPEPFSITYTDNQALIASASSHTFSNVSIGDASPVRMIVAGINSVQDPGLTTSCTIGGITATRFIDVEGATDTDIEIWYAMVPTGTTADIQINSSNSSINPEVAVYRVISASTTLFDSIANTEIAQPPPMSLDVNTEAGGGVIAFANSFLGNHTHEWAGATKDFNINNFSGASHEATTTETPRSISVNDAVDNSWAVIGAAISLQAA